MFLSLKKENKLFSTILIASLLLVSFVFCGVFTSANSIVASAVDTHNLNVTINQSYGDFSIVTERSADIVSITESGAVINELTDFTLKITANNGYVITGLPTDDYNEANFVKNAEGTEATLVIDDGMSSNITTSASFELAAGYAHSVTFDLRGGIEKGTETNGQIIIGVEDSTFINTNYGTDSEYTFPDENEGVLRGWYTDAGLTTLYNGTDITADTTLYANWAKIIDFEIIQSKGGTISRTGAGPLAESDNVTFYVVPLEAYKVNSITINGELLSSEELKDVVENGYQTTLAIGEDYSITATYNVKIFTLTNILIVLGALVVVGLFIWWYIYAVKSEKEEQENETEIKVASKKIKTEKEDEESSKVKVKKASEKEEKFSMEKFNKVLEEETKERKVIKKAPAVKKTGVKKPVKKIVKKTTTKK